MNTQIAAKNTATVRSKLLAILFFGLASAAAQAGDVFFDMDSNPFNLPDFMIVGSHWDTLWYPTGGNPDTGGYLSIADGGVGGQNLVCVFPDIDNGLPVKAFHLTADVRAGNSGNADGRPADGFSVSYCREGDVLLVNATNAYANGNYNVGIGGAAGGDSGAEATSPAGSGDLENGTKTGVAICFDAWQGNWLPDTGPNGTPGPDVEGIEIRVDDHTLRQIDMQADRNGNCYYPTNDACGGAVCADFNTEQTGPWSNDGGLYTGLCWARLDVELNTNKQVTVIWKGHTFLDHFALTNYANHRGRLVLMGRTGGNNQNAHFDNIHLVTVPAVEATFGTLAFGPGLNQFHFTIDDNGASVVTNVSQVILDGADVTASVAVTKNGGQTLGTYTQPALFVSGSKHTVSVTWRTSLGQTLSSPVLQFTVTSYLSLPASLAVSPSSVDQSQPGFFVRPFQTDAADPNRNYWADEQLEGLHGTNVIDFSTVPNVTNGNEVAWSGVMDFANTGSGGQFPVDNPWTSFGIPSPTKVNEDNSSIAAATYLYFPASGIYTFGVNSDDGFRLSFAKNSRDVLGTEVPSFLFDGGRGIGNNQNSGVVYVAQPGYYGARLMFYNGGGGSGLEFYTTSTPVSGSTNILVNDTNTPGALLAYRVSTAAPPFVSLAKPPLDDNQVLANLDLQYDLTDDSTSVNVGSIALTVNGVLRSPTITHSGNVTHIVQAHPPALWPAGTNTVSLAFQDSAGAGYTYNYTFVVSPYATLPTNVRTVPGSGFNPGFRLKAFQTANTNILNGWKNITQMAIEAVEGFYAGNEADLTAFTHNGEFVETGVINYSQNSAGAVTDNGDFRSTDSPTPHPDAAFPGLPGLEVATMDNDAIQAKTFVEFPSAGFYIMGVNSDDGFRVAVGDRMGPGRSMLSVLAPAGLAGDYLAMQTSVGIQDGAFGGPLPTPPIIGQAVLSDPPWPSSLPNNASALAGRIAILHRDPSGGVAAHSANAQAAGAVAVVVVDQDDLGPTRQPGVWGGTANVTIPVVMIDYNAGTNLIAHATTTASSPIVMSIGDGSNLKLGEFNGGRGSADTVFGVNVPQAGLYPLWLVWENAGGDANCEWFTVDPATAVKTLINDPASSVKAWTARSFSVGARFNPPVVSGGSLNLSWTGSGELEQACSAAGPWFQAVNQNNPQSVPLNTPGIGQTFFRIRQY